MLRVSSWFAVACVASTSFVMAAEPKDWAKENVAAIVEIYRHLHANPELSLQEKETAARLADELGKVGAEVTTGVGGHGVVGLLKNGPGKMVMLRTDLDALPVTEQTGLVYASQKKVKGEAGEVGVMHACGHDIHIANQIGVARYLAANKTKWQGTVMFIGQPAEERGLGARKMLEDKLFERFPKPDYGIALHCDHDLAAGRIGTRGGWMLANVDSVDITVLGKGGHGAHPQSTVDPIVQAAQLVLALQSIVSREMNPLEPAVVTVGSIHGGSKHNIIGDSCHLQLTVRSYTDEVRKKIHESIIRRAKGIAAACGAPEPKIEFSEGTPALFNDEKLTARMTEFFKKELGEAQVEMSDQSMGGEDFSEFGRAGVPIMMYRLGTVNSQRLQRFKTLGQTPPSLHSPLFYPDAEEALEVGLRTMSAAVLHLLEPKK